MQPFSGQQLMLHTNGKAVYDNGSISELMRHLDPQNITHPNRKDVSENNFALRGIDPHEILELYRTGHFSECTVPTTKITRFNTNQTVTQRHLGNNKYDQAYQIREGGRTRLYVTTGQKDFEAASTMIQSGIDPREIHLLRENKCDKCGRNLNELPSDAYPVGIPIKVVKKGETYIFHTVLKHCTFGCARENLIGSLHNKFGDYISEDCIQWLQFMFNLMYPNRKLVSPPDRHLREENGGPMPDGEYYSSSTYYYKTPNIICIPTKQEYGILEGGPKCVNGF